MQSMDTVSPESIDMSELSLLGQGRTAEVLLFRGKFVLKLFRPNFPKQAIENEFLVCRSIGSLIDIPKAHEHVILAGRDAIVFDFIKGESGFRYLLRNPWSVKSFAREFAAIHAKVHSVSVPDTVPDLKSILIRNINLHDALPADAKAKIIENLNGLPGGSALCHGDFHPENILIGKEKNICSRLDDRYERQSAG